MLRSTWDLQYGEVIALRTETSTAKAVTRRLGIPLRFDYTFTTDDGTQVMRIDKELSMRDKYTVTVTDGSMPYAVAVGMTVAQDAFDDR